MLCALNIREIFFGIKSNIRTRNLVVHSCYCIYVYEMSGFVQSSELFDLRFENGF
jgi:hypothetical protein